MIKAVEDIFKQRRFIISRLIYKKFVNRIANHAIFSLVKQTVEKFTSAMSFIFIRLVRAVALAVANQFLIYPQSIVSTFPFTWWTGVI